MMTKAKKVTLNEIIETAEAKLQNTATDNGDQGSKRTSRKNNDGDNTINNRVKRQRKNVLPISNEHDKEYHHAVATYPRVDEMSMHKNMTGTTVTHNATTSIAQEMYDQTRDYLATYHDHKVSIPNGMKQIELQIQQMRDELVPREPLLPVTPPLVQANRKGRKFSNLDNSSYTIQSMEHQDEIAANLMMNALPKRDVIDNINSQKQSNITATTTTHETDTMEQKM